MKNILLTLLGGYTLFAIVAYYANIFPVDVRAEYQAWVYQMAPVISVLVGIYSYTRISDKRLKVSVLLFTISIFCWLVGESIWLYQDLFVGEIIYPSIADFFFLIAYPLMLFGALRTIKYAELKLTNAVVIVGTLLILGLSIFTIQQGIINAYDSEVSVFVNLVVMSSGVSDVMVLITGLVLLVSSLSRPSIKTAWIAFSLAMVATWLADIIYSINYDAYIENVLDFAYLDLLWIAWYLLMAFAMIKLVDANAGQPESA